jgi:hypothetical protein
MRLIKGITRILGVVATLAVAGCESLDVENPNAPDTGRALSDPAVIANVVGGTWSTWFSAVQGDASIVLTDMADSYTGSWNNFNMRIYSTQPRIAWINDPAATQRVTIEWFWYALYSMLSSANDGLIAIRQRGVDMGANGAMVETAALLAQGMALGWLALHYDQAFVVTEATPRDPQGAPIVDLSPRDEVLDSALAKLDEAIAEANANTFTLPASWFGGSFSHTNTRVAQIANSMAARILAYYPRTAAENSAVDWARVATYASQGISSGTPFDLRFTQIHGCIPPYTFCDMLKAWGEDPTTMRTHTRVAQLLDPATQVHPWPGAPGNARPNSADRRLGDGSFGTAVQATSFGGVAATPNAGTDFMWSSRAIFPAERGSWFQSNIAHIRYFYAGFSDPTGGGFGDVPQMLAAENDLLWAEGLIRSGGNLTTAANLINNTRVTRGGLPAATAGDADLLTKLQYEQDVELIGSGEVPYFNQRRIGNLEPLTPLEFPIPAKELGVLQMELYTFGGPIEPGCGTCSALVVGGPRVKHVTQIWNEMLASRAAGRNPQ